MLGVAVDFVFWGAVRVLKVFFRGLDKFYGLRRNTVEVGECRSAVGGGEREKRKICLNLCLPQSITTIDSTFNISLPSFQFDFVRMPRQSTHQTT